MDQTYTYIPVPHSLGISSFCQNKALRRFFVCEGIRSKCSLIVLLLVPFLFFFPETPVLGQKTAVVSGNWESMATWGNQQPPTASDAVIINNNITVTINSAAACASLTFPAGVNSSSVVIAGTNSLTVGGAISVTAPTGNNNTRTLSVGNGNLTAGSLLLDGGNGKRTAILNIGGGTATISGNITGGGSKSEIYITGSGSIQIGAGLSGISLLSLASGSTVNYFGSGAQTAFGTTYSTLKINNPAGVTPDAAFTVTSLVIGDVTPNSLFSDGSFQVSSTGTLNIQSGTFRLGSGNKSTSFPQFSNRIYGPGATVEFASGQAQTVAATGYPNLVLSGNGVKTSATGSLTVSGNLSCLSTFRLNTFNTAVTVTGNVTGSGPLQQGAGTLTVAGNWTNTGTFLAGTGGVVYNGASQVAGPCAYNNLTLTGTGVKTTSGITVNGILSMQGTATTTAAPVYGTGASLEYKGSAQQITGPEFLPSMAVVTVDNANGVVLSVSRTITSSLTLVSGKVITGTYILTMGSNAAITGAGSTKYIQGNLARSVAASASAVSRLFEVGDEAVYAPVSITFQAVTGAGTITVSTVGAEDPQIGTSQIDPGHDLNRYWIITNSSTIFPSASATFTFVPGDLDPGADPAQFIIGKYDLAWSYPTTGSMLPTSIQATGLTAFSRFTAGLQASAITILTQPVSQSACEGSTVTFTSTASGSPAPSVRWQVKTQVADWTDMVPAQTSTTLLIPSVSLSQSGNQYRAVFTNLLNSVISNPASLTVNPSLPVSISITASANSVCQGTEVTFTASPVNGGSAPHYQWKVNGLNAGTDQPVYTYAPQNLDQVTCTLTSSLVLCAPGNPATSNTVLMNVLAKRIVSGKFVYNNLESTPLAGVIVKLVQGSDTLASVQTDATGHYAFPAECPGQYKVVARSYMPTGGINSTDVAQVNYWASLPYKICMVRFLAGDVAGEDPGLPPNNYITAYDAQRIQAYYISGGTVPFDRTSWSFWTTSDSIQSNPVLPNTDTLYPLVTLGGSPLTLDFYGLSTGDFNRSFVPSATKQSAGDLELVTTPGLLTQSGEVLELPVRTRYPMIVGALSLALRIPVGIDILGVRVPDDNSDAAWNVSGDILRISWFSGIPLDLSAGDILLTLEIRILENAKPIKTGLSLFPDPLTEVADGEFRPIHGVTLVTDELELGTTEPASSGPKGKEALTLANYPNPFENQTTIWYSISSEGFVAIEIRDLLGNLVYSVPEVSRAPGQYQFQLDPGGLPDGIYTGIGRFKTGTGEEIKIFKLVHCCSH